MNRIRQARKEIKKTQREVSNDLKIPQNTLSQYENNKREPKLETWDKLANYFGVSIGYLQGVTKETSFNLGISLQVDEKNHRRKRMEHEEMLANYPEESKQIKESLEDIFEAREVHFIFDSITDIYTGQLMTNIFLNTERIRLSLFDYSYLTEINEDSTNWLVEQSEKVNAIAEEIYKFHDDHKFEK